ncbi:MAG: armadillo-type protein [Monoraphidium minutum]|nr:MAG: armadillo-type protein [Monoraphidium minutum]
MGADQLSAAFRALFHSDDAATKVEANRWLDAWQQTPGAWGVADAVLHDPASSQDLQQFCAQTLKTKVQRDFEELPPEAVAQLRDSLFALLLRAANARAQAVRTQLALALAALAAHVPAAAWGEGGVLRWFAERFGGQAGDVGLSCMLEMLTVLPQEADSRKIACRPERRAAFQGELRGYLPHALEVLTSCLSQPEHVRGQVLEAFGCWLRLSCGRGLPEGFEGHPLVAAAAAGLRSEGTFHEAVDAVCELVWVTVDPATCAPNPAMQPLAADLVHAVMELRPRFTTALRVAQAEEEGRPGAADEDVADEFDDDFDAIKGMGRLFCEVGEAYLPLILTATPEVMPPVEALLEVAGHPDADIYGMSFAFWYKLSKWLRIDAARPSRSGSMASSGSTANMTDAGGGGGGELPGPPPPSAADAAAAGAERARQRAFFAPAFEKLLAIARSRMRAPDNLDDMGSGGRSEWKRVRSAWGDVLVDAAAALRPERALPLLLAPLHDVGRAVAGGGPLDWQAAELALHCVRCIRKVAASPGDPQLEALMAALPSLPAGPPGSAGAGQLRYTAALVVAGYSDWLGRSMAAGRCQGLLQSLLPMLLSSLAAPAAAPAAAIAIRGLCDKCSGHMQPCLDQLMQLYSQVLKSGAAARLAAAAGGANPLAGSGGGGGGDAGARVAEEDVLMVVEGVGLCVSRAIPEQQLMSQGFPALLGPVLEPLAAAVSPFPPTPVSALPIKDKLPLVDRLATLLQSLDRQSVAGEALRRSWPIMDTCFTAALGSEEGLERVCRALRQGIKAAGLSGLQLLPALLQALPARFQQTRHPALLYVASELVKVFAREPAAAAALGPILAALIVGSCQELGSLQALTARPDLTDDLFLLAGRALNYSPVLIVTPQVLPPLLDVALLATLVQHREACRSALAFLRSLLHPSGAPAALGSSPAAAALLQSELLRAGPALARLLLAGAAGAQPDARVSDIAEPLGALLRLAGPPALGWVSAAVGGVPAVALEPGDQQMFLGMCAVLANAAGSGGDEEAAEFEGALFRVADLCRRNGRARVAAQQALLPPELQGVAV